MQARFYISRGQRELNARNHSASAFERKVGEMVGAFGGMLPISLVSAINPVAGAAMSGLNTAGKTSRDAIESGNGIGSALAYGLVAGSVDFALNALSSTAFQARGQGGWGEKLVSRVAKTRGGDLALRTIAGTLVDTGADTLSLLMQHNIKKMYDPNYKETLSEEEVLKTIAVSLVVNGGMRLGTNMSKGVYETDADGMLKPLDEARMMGQMPKGADEPKIMDMEGDESDGLSGMFQEVEGNKSGISVDDSDIINTPNKSGGKYEYNMVENPGPLADIDLEAAGTFESGKYNVEKSEHKSILYRAGDSEGSALGQYYTREKPTSVAHVRIDSAVKPQWIDPATGSLQGVSNIDCVYTIEFPEGIDMYSGPTGYQGGIYLGGNEQIFIHQPWKLEGIKILGKEPLR